MPRPVIEYRSISREAYKRFKKEHPKVKISYETFKKIIKVSNGLIVDHILDTGEKFRLPHGFGDISIHKWRPKKYVNHNGVQRINLPVDWPKSRLLGKKTYHLNSHTDGYRYKWKWFQRTSRLETSKCMVFKPNRLISRRLASYLKNPNSTYAQTYRSWT